VIFRDGDRTPSSIWKTNPYYNESFYEPYGYGQLTNEGKNKVYKLGQYLRKRYAGFLGDAWNMKTYDAWATSYNRTKMSLELVLAGLFPPTGSTKWSNELLWQPAPYNYVPIAQDKELLSYNCPTVVPLIYSDQRNLERLHAYDSLMEILSNGTRKSVDYLDALDIYVILQIQEHLGLKLENWTQAVYPQPLRNFYAEFYYIETSTPLLKRILGGYLLKKILTDTQNKLKGTLIPQERKIFIYSGHEINVAMTLITLNAGVHLTDSPPFGSHLLFEIHEINGVNGIKLFYQDYTTTEPQLLTIRGCAEFCPIDDFVKITADLIPKSDAECYGN